MIWWEDQQNQKIRSTVTVPDHFKGYPAGVIPPGIVTAILDETAGRAVMLKSGP